MKKYFTEREVIAILKDEVEKCATMGEFARKAGVSLAFLGDTIRGNRTLTPKILGALGLKKNIRYERNGVK